MMFKKYLAAITTGAFLLFNCDEFSTIQSAEFNQAQIEILPLTSFLFANRDPMRVGWHFESINKAVKNLKSITKKPAETRMGKGKGSPEFWVARVAPGRIMFELDGVSWDLAQEAFKLAAAKLPIETKIVRRLGDSN